MTIYVIRHSDDDIWKIGYTNGDANARLKQLQTGNPHRLELYAAFPGDVLLEKAIHTHLTLYHTTGGSEWFIASQDEIDVVILTYGSRWTSEPVAKTSVACRDCYYLRSSTTTRGREVHKCEVAWDRQWSALDGAVVPITQQSIEKARSRIGECGPNGKLYKNAEEERQRQQRLQRAEAGRQAKLKVDHDLMILKGALAIGTATVILYALVFLSSVLYRAIIPPRMDTQTPIMLAEVIAEGAVQPTVTPPRTQTDVVRGLTETPLLIFTETPAPTETPTLGATPTVTPTLTVRPTIVSEMVATSQGKAFVATDVPVTSRKVPCREQAKEFISESAHIAAMFMDDFELANELLTASDRTVKSIPVSHMIDLKNRYDSLSVPTCALSIKVTTSSAMGEYIDAFTIFEKHGPISQATQKMEQGSKSMRAARILVGEIENE